MLNDLKQNWDAPSAPKPIMIIGAGGIVNDAHLPAYRMAGLEVTGVTDLDADRMKATAEKFGIPNLYPNQEAAVAALGNSVVYDVAVPPNAIVPILEKLPDEAAVLIQKPMGGDLAEARKIRAICREKKLRAAINFQLRFSPMMMAAAQAVKQGMIGALLEIDLHINIFTPWTLFPFLIPMKRVELLVHSIHYFDTIRAIAGNPAGVFARTMRDPRAQDFAQTRTSAILDYGDQLRCNVSINHNHQNGRKFQDAWFRFEGTEGCIMVKLGVDFDYPNGEPDEFWFGTNGAEWQQLPLTGSWFIEAFMGPMRNVQRYAAGEDTFLYTDIEDAFETMALIEALFEAAETKGTPLVLY